MPFDEDVLHCLEECAALELTYSATKQVQLPLTEVWWSWIGDQSLTNP